MGAFKRREWSPEDLAKYDLASRSAKGHRTQIREALGFRPATRADEERLTAWLAAEVCPVELVEERLRAAVLVQCRSDRIEPPGRIERMVAAARARADRQFCAQTVARPRGPRRRGVRRRPPTSKDARGSDPPAQPRFLEHAHPARTAPPWRRSTPRASSAASSTPSTAAEIDARRSPGQTRWRTS
ncbi:DUF4158 domain-containing protein [Microbispora triticiradicis]|uniref:DUF4158 domain-containing protein n=1 Tax=Microbispora TaxID=2005 RepID=UPI001ABF272B